MTSSLPLTTSQLDASHASIEPPDSLLDNRALPFRGVFHPLGFSVEIYTNDPEVLAAAHESWGHLPPRRLNVTIQICIGVTDSRFAECPPAPAFRTQHHMLTLIADEENRATADLRAGFGFMWISRSTLQHRLYFRYHFLESIALILVSGIFAPAIHAACVSHHDRGLLLIGPSGAGKSTLSYACARAGFTYTSDDASYLLRDADHARVVGHSHKFRFRPASRELFPELRGYELAPRLDGKPSIEVPTSALHGLTTASEARITHLILLKRASSTTAELRPVSTDAALKSLAEGLYPVDEIRRLQIKTLQQLASLEAFEFHYADLDQAVSCLKNLTTSSEPQP